MNSIVVIGNQANWHFRDLQRASKPLGFELQFIHWHQIAASVGTSFEPAVDGEKVEIVDETGCLLPADRILVRGMPNGTLEQVVFAMDALARWQATGARVVNSAKSLEAAINKYLSLALMHEAGLPVPETVVCQSVDAAASAFHRLGGDVVLKPVFGGEGRGLIRLQQEELAIRAFRTIAQLNGTLYLQRFIQHGNRDIRCFVVGDNVFGMERHNPHDWRTNATRGANCRAIDLNEQQKELAFRAVKANGAEFGGVDLLTGPDGQIFVVEVNGIPGWQHLSEVTGQDIASNVLELF